VKKDILSSDNVTFNISQVAKMIGVVPETIRNWEKNSLFQANRSKNNYRIFTLDDLEILKKIKDYSINQGMGINAIKKLLPSTSTNPIVNLVNEEKTPTYSKKLLSKKWKSMRQKKGYTLEEVSSVVGISPSHLSKLENEHANVSLDVLHKLANFYGESTVYFFDLDVTEDQYIPREKGESIDIGIPGIDMRSLISVKEHNIYPILYTIEPGCGNLDSHSHNGEEFIYILSGKIEITLNSQEYYVLKKGDSFYFRGSESHSWKNPSFKNKTKLLWVHSSLGY